MKYSKNQKLALMEAWRSSGLSRPKFCEAQDLKYTTFLSWFSQDLSPVDQRADRFIEIISSEMQSDSCEIIFPNGIRLQQGGKLSAQLISALYHA